MDEPDEYTALLAIGSSAVTDPDFEPSPSRSLYHLITQSELNDLAGDLGFSKIKAELLGSRLQEWHLLSQGKNSVFRRRQKDINKFVAQIDDVTFCVDIEGLFLSWVVTMKNKRGEYLLIRQL